MPFFPRNRYHLRVSSSTILPLYVSSFLYRACQYPREYINLQVYLDSQHVDWMSDQILRQVVADLRPK